MSMTLAGYEFDGPIMKTGDLKTLPGVFCSDYGLGYISGLD
jgi:hypothetical protein